MRLVDYIDPDPHLTIAFQVDQLMQNEVKTFIMSAAYDHRPLEVDLADLHLLPATWVSELSSQLRTTTRDHSTRVHFKGGTVGIQRRFKAHS